MCDDNYMCKLDNAFIKKAKDELNESPEDRKAAVQALREWVQTQPHLSCPKTDTIFLLRFLRWAKFSQIRARQKLEGYLNFRNTIPVIFADIDTKEAELNNLLESEALIRSPNRHPSGCDVLIFNVANLQTLKHKYDVHLRLQTVVMEYMSRQDMNQVNGTMFIGDYTGTSPTKLAKLLTKENSHFIKMWMDGFPGRFKSILYYNAGIFIEMAIAFLRPLVPKKMIDRISVHDTMESIYKKIPHECLPVEYLPDDYNGPNAGTIQECIDNMKSSMWDKEFHDDLLYRTSKAFNIDSSKKPKEELTQHFRKLNVD